MCLIKLIPSTDYVLSVFVFLTDGFRHVQAKFELYLLMLFYM